MLARAYKYIPLFLITIVLALALSACSSPKRAIVGQWEQSGGGETIEFFKDGTVVSTSFGVRSTGDYAWVDDSHIRINMTGLFGLGGSQVFLVNISSDTLELAMSGVTYTYSRLD
jgi:hypothetical protein